MSELSKSFVNRNLGAEGNSPRAQFNQMVQGKRSFYKIVHGFFKRLKYHYVNSSPDNSSRQLAP